MINNKACAIYSNNYENLIGTLQEILPNFGVHLVRARTKHGCRFAVSSRELKDQELDTLFKSLNGGESKAEVRFQFIPHLSDKKPVRPFWMKGIRDWWKHTEEL
jgi:hypothetical protein